MRRTALLIAVLAGCGDDNQDAIEAVCDHFESCDFAFPGDCNAFYQKVFDDLAARCTNVDEVHIRYRDSLTCVSATACDKLLMTCQSQRLAYESAKVAGGSGCEPDDD